MPADPALDQLPPHNVEAEAGALACVLDATNGEAEARLDRLTFEHFYDQRNQTAFRALRCLRINGKPLDSVSLCQWLRDKHQTEDAGGLEYVSELPDKTPSPANFPAFLDAIEGCRIRRAAIRDAGEVQRLALDTSIPPAAVADASRRMLQSNAEHGSAHIWGDMVEDGADLQARELPPVVQIVSGLVAELSKLSIVSSAKCFKTWLTIYLAIATSQGIEFLGHATSRRRVLYVNLELKPATFTRRIKAIASALGITIDRAWFFHLPLRGKLSGLTVHEIISRIIAVAQKRGATVIIVDPLFKLNIEGEENSSRDQTVFCNELDRLTTEGHCTAIFNDHAPKGNMSEKEPLDVIRGSSAKGGDLDAAMVLRKHEVDGCFRVDMVHRELPPVEPFCIGWRFPLMELRPDLSPDDMKRPKAGRKRTQDPIKLLAKIADTSPGKPVSKSEWARRAGIERQNLDTYLPEMRCNGWIKTVGEGNTARQCITEKGQKALPTA